jgi:hypothetical protein
MNLECGLAHAEFQCRLLVEQATDDQLQDLAFARGQTRELLLQLGELLLILVYRRTNCFQQVLHLQG